MAALPDTRMPGVYTQEVPTLAPSIGVVPSAVPCFIGYTEKAEKNGEDISLKPVRIRNIREYEDWFGTSPNQQISIDLNEIIDDSDPANPKTVRLDTKVASIADFKFRMHYAMQLYYANGGGPSFIVSAGLQSGGIVEPDDLIAGLDAAKKAKQVTILSFPDAVKNMTSENHYGSLTSAALLHCFKMKNRVLIVDVNDAETDNETVTSNFRSKVPQSINQKYAAAYYPMLSTTLNYKFDEDADEGVEVRFHRKNGNLSKEVKSISNALDEFNAASNTTVASVKTEGILKLIKETIDPLIVATPTITPAELLKVSTSAVKNKYKAKELSDTIAKAFEGVDAGAVQNAVDVQLAAATDKVTTDQGAADGKKKTYLDLVDKQRAAPVADNDYSFKSLKQVKNANNLFFNRIKEAVQDIPVIMPPSPAIAGLLVQTDATQGPWKAPANAGLAAVLAPTVDVDDDFHADLNVDANSGKSVNAIRAYEGKGILVFGARTLAGNDLEWRYISVRRTFCFIEDSVGLAMQDFVFAPNTRDTWIKVKAMISNFLIEIWKAGGLFGNTTNEAFQVNVGLPETMTDVDILEGRMIIDIKLRVARPAEFIILRYEHKFQANAA